MSSPSDRPANTDNKSTTETSTGKLTTDQQEHIEDLLSLLDDDGKPPGDRISASLKALQALSLPLTLRDLLVRYARRQSQGTFEVPRPIQGELKRLCRAAQDYGRDFDVTAICQESEPDSRIQALNRGRKLIEDCGDSQQEIDRRLQQFVDNAHRAGIDISQADILEHDLGASEDRDHSLPGPDGVEASEPTDTGAPDGNETGSERPTSQGEAGESSDDDVQEAVETVDLTNPGAHGLESSDKGDGETLDLSQASGENSAESGRETGENQPEEDDSGETTPKKAESAPEREVEGSDQPQTDGDSERPGTAIEELVGQNTTMSSESDHQTTPESQQDETRQEGDAHPSNEANSASEERSGDPDSDSSDDESRSPGAVVEDVVSKNATGGLPGQRTGDSATEQTAESTPPSEEQQEEQLDSDDITPSRDDPSDPSSDAAPEEITEASDAGQSNSEDGEDENDAVPSTAEEPATASQSGGDSPESTPNPDESATSHSETASDRGTVSTVDEVDGIGLGQVQFHSDQIGPDEDVATKTTEREGSLSDGRGHIHNLVEIEYVLDDSDHSPVDVDTGGIIRVDDETFAAIARVQPRSWRVLPPKQQRHVYNMFQAAVLMHLKYSTQFIKYPITYDVSSHIENIEEAQKRVKNGEVDNGAKSSEARSKLLADGRELHKRWIEQFMEQNDINDRRFAVIVTVSKDDLRDDGGLDSLAEKIPFADAAMRLFPGDKDQREIPDSKCVEVLNRRLEELTSKTSQTTLNLQIERIDDRDTVLRIFHHYYNNRTPEVEAFSKTGYCAGAIGRNGVATEAEVVDETAEAEGGDLA